ncbi:MAG TPA: PP2C family protein-serine/threonine phosphatase [Spirochaetota bacterium]|nr:PP2C family protein-serine/threonine phosphatase [Spirochaetota bacterium]HPV42996.1 PP2C family protein-serine/threonine phosphatase [Spirochaetota bacterium]
MKGNSSRITTSLAAMGFVTACYGILDMPSMEFTYARAGHPCPILVRNGQPIHLESRGGFIGPMQKNDFETRSAPLKQGDRILLYTDGLIEAKNGDDRMFEKILWEEVLPSAGGPGADFLDEIYRKLVSFKGGDHFEDDICMVGIEIMRQQADRSI